MSPASTASYIISTLSTRPKRTLNPHTLPHTIHCDTHTQTVHPLQTNNRQPDYLASILPQKRRERRRRGRVEDVLPDKSSRSHSDHNRRHRHNRRRKEEEEEK